MQWRSLGILALCVGCGASVKPPALSIDRTSVEFPTTVPGEASAETTIRVSNVGGSPTGALATSLAGPDAAAFRVTSDGCGGISLAPAATCDLRLAFHPSEERQFAAQLQVGAGTASAASAVSGRGEGGVQLSLSGTLSFGGVRLGQSPVSPVTISNQGRAASLPLKIDVSGDTGDFNVSGDCAGRTLASGQSCALRVAFGPSTAGPKTLAVTVSGSASGASLRATFDGYGIRTVSVVVNADGAGEVGLQGSAESTFCRTRCAYSVDLKGPPETVTLAVIPDARTVFAGWSGDCAGSDSACTLQVDGDRTVTAKFVPAVSVTFVADSVAAGSGTVTIEPGVSCTAPCRATALVARGSRVRLSADADAQSQMRWKSGCSGTETACELVATQDISAGAIFNGANYVFVTSTFYTANLGIAAYDDACNQRARAAGLPGSYVAWMSTNKASAASRVGAARGFVRVDGRPFADSLGPASPIYYPPALNELGSVATFPYTITGTDQYGQLVVGANCSDWSDGSSSSWLAMGNAFGGAGAWSWYGGAGCNWTAAIQCIGTGISRPLAPPTAAGRLAFVSSGALAAGAGVAAADSLCASEARLAGLSGSFKALLAVDGRAATDRFDLRGLPWRRIDGVAIVDTASALAEGKLNAPIDVTAFGAYAFNAGWAWMGAYTPGQAGAAAMTCKSWTSSSADDWGIATMVRNLANGGADVGALPCNFGPYPVYCFQE